jgi:phosphatidylserine/phosphatidylglycerophosphate/cardiolipin synthase-like enzyme
MTERVLEISAEVLVPPAPRIVEQPCRHYGSAALRWPARPDLEPFMRATYDAHIARSCRRRAFRAAVPAAELAQVAKDQRLRRDTVPLARRMLAEAAEALRTARDAGDQRALAVRSFGVSSAYRSAERQFRLWNDRFPGYFARTQKQRNTKPGGPTGPAAAAWLAAWIGGWLAAPGFSNHNEGRAVDLYCALHGAGTLSADSGHIPRWRESWLHAWLVDNAARFGFHPYEPEPWHWEHRPGTQTETEAGPPPGGTARRAGTPAEYWQQQLRFGLAGNKVEPLVDGAAAFRAMRRAIDSARGSDHYVYLAGWWMDPWVNLDGPGTCLLDLFARAGRRGVQVRVLVWEPSRLTAGEHVKLHDAAVAAINRLPNCHAQQDAGGALAKAHHQKLLVVRGSAGLLALAGGVDVNADRLHDLPPPPGSYRTDRPAVGWTGASGSGGSGPAGSGNPLHDVHTKVSGPSALPLLRMFLRRWWARSGDRVIDTRAPLRGRYDEPAPRPAGTQYVRVGETFNGVLRLPGREVRSREVSVQDIWLRSILGARRFIYMEEQYLQSECAALAIRQVLPRLEHMTILLPPSEITDLPGVWQRRRAFLERITANNPHAAKLHVYTRTAGPRQPCVRANAPHLYIHSKMAVIDDELLLVGSANCNNRGWETDSELVVASFENARGAASVAGRLRAQLWSHHLGVPLGKVTDPIAARPLWDNSPGHVCRYDPTAARDRFGSDRPDRLVDPSDRRPGDPCDTLLAPQQAIRTA